MSDALNSESVYRSESQAGIQAAAIAKALDPVRWSPGDLATVSGPKEWSTHLVDLESQLAAPRRARGTVQVHSADSFVAVCGRLVDEEGPDAVGLYADETANKLVAVLNDDIASAPGWRDHRVELVLRHTPEWEHWHRNQGLKSQQDFAETIEAGLTEIHEPAAATMLTIAETFEAKVDVNFAQGADMGRGRRQLTFNEKVTAKAGEGGALEIPEKMVLGLRPFIGGDAYKVEAKIKFRLREGKLAIGYVLDRPHETLRDAFLNDTQKVAAALQVALLQGVAPGAVTPHATATAIR
ncbi:DUF2303 family protein [Desertimonas flava]|uniref:DUF2303 family protein n=1 Tax=Desertimonas flava TaxID=2064846 RepID=UPI0013C5186B|nr:DUF2303 family protein [Desertimonas flava]